MKATLNRPEHDERHMPSPSSPSDEQLLARYCERRDREAFDELVQRYERELYSYLRRYLSDAEMAEDAFQAAFLQVHLKCDQFEPGRAFRPWLYTIATNQAIDAQRRNRRHRAASLNRSTGHSGDDVGRLVDTLVSPEASPAAQVGSLERGEWLKRTLAELPEPLRDALMLVYFQNLKYREAAESLNIPVGTVKSRVHSAILKLTEAWNQAQSESP